MARDLSIQKQAVNEHLSVIALDGHLDARTAPQLEQAIRGELDAGRFRIIVDGSALQYVASAGFGVFMTFLDEIREHGGDLKICALCPRVRQTFDLLGFEAIFHIADDVTAAVRLFDEAPVKEVDVDWP